MLHVVLLLLGVTLLFRELKRIVQGDSFAPTDLCLLLWGVVTVFAGLDFVRYDPITLPGVATVVACIGVIWFLNRRLRKRFRGTSSLNEAVSGAELRQLLLVARVAAALVFLGMAGRYYHNGILNDRTLAMDIGERYLAAGELTRSSIGSRLAWLAGFWPLPLGVAVLFFRRLTWMDRGFLLVSGFGQALNTYYLGGRSGIGLTAVSAIGLYLMSVQAEKLGLLERRRRFRGIVVLGAMTSLVLLLLMYLFERRSQSTAERYRYSEVMEINPAYTPLVEVIQQTGLVDGIIGAVGYLSSPVQRLSMYFGLGIEARMSGAFNFDLPALVLRKVGIGERHYAINLGDIVETYENLGNAPLGTFSTVIRDFHLDFGWLGVLIGIPAICLLGDIAYYRLRNEGRLEYVPIVAVWFGFMGMNPVVSGLTITGGNQALFASIFCWWLIRNLRRGSRRHAGRNVVPAPEGGLPAATR